MSDVRVWFWSLHLMYDCGQQTGRRRILGVAQGIIIRAHGREMSMDFVVIEDMPQNCILGMGFRENTPQRLKLQEEELE